MAMQGFSVKILNILDGNKDMIKIGQNLALLWQTHSSNLHSYNTELSMVLFALPISVNMNHMKHEETKIPVCTFPDSKSCILQMQQM